MRGVGRTVGEQHPSFAMYRVNTTPRSRRSGFGHALCKSLGFIRCEQFHVLAAADQVAIASFKHKDDVATHFTFVNFVSYSTHLITSSFKVAVCFLPLPDQSALDIQFRQSKISVSFYRKSTIRSFMYNRLLSLVFGLLRGILSQLPDGPAIMFQAVIR
jgi:hypothetical protein